MNDPKKNKVQYCVSISPLIHKKLEQHLFILRKLLQPGLTKEGWLTDAVREKLERESPEKIVKKEKRINIRIDLLTNKNLAEYVKMSRCFQYSYSKKKLVLEAIQEKLEEEEDGARKKFIEYRELLKK